MIAVEGATGPMTTVVAGTVAKTTAVEAIAVLFDETTGAEMADVELANTGLAVAVFGAPTVSYCVPAGWVIKTVAVDGAA